MLGKLVFNTTDAETIADSHHVGSHTLSGVGSLITSGDGDSDNLVNTAIEGLDVRSFMYGYDAVGDNWDRIQQVAGAVKVFIDDGDFEVDVVINAEKAEDAAHGSGDIGNYVLNVRVDDITAANTAFLAGTEGDYQSFLTSARGELWVKDQDVDDLLTTIDSVLDSIKVDTGSIDTTLSGLSHDEDSAHTSGDAGIQSLSVRIDDLDSAPAGTLAGTEGDYQSLHTSARGALYVKHDGEVQVGDAALANTAIAHFQQAATADDTAESTVDSILANRKYLFLQNKGNKEIAIGGAGVDIASGFVVPPETYVQMRAGAAIDVQWAARKSAGSDLRALELS